MASTSASRGKEQRALRIFMKTLNYEEVFRKEYRDLAAARRSIEIAIISRGRALRRHISFHGSGPVPEARRRRGVADTDRRRRSLQGKSPRTRLRHISRSALAARY